MFSLFQLLLQNANFFFSFYNTMLLKRTGNEKCQLAKSTFNFYCGNKVGDCKQERWALR